MNKSIHQRCAFGIINCIRTLWQEQDLQDFNVQVDDASFHCHRVLLGACSPVFRGMFKSGMKEDKAGFAKLQEISKETFQLVLTVLYTGRDVLTADNFINIWKAAHMLQIDFLVQHCEKCAKKFIKVENFHEFKENAKSLGSKTVLKVTRKFILKNFDSVRKTQGFFNLSSSYVLSIIKRQDLVVSSEDIVLEAIIDWADYDKDEPATEQSLDGAIQRKRGSGSHEKANNVGSFGIVNTEGSGDHEKANNVGSVGIVNTEGSGDHEKANNVGRVNVVNTEGSGVNHQEEELRDKTREVDYKGNDVLTRHQPQAVHHKSRRESLASLLKATRLCLASSLILKSLYKHELVRSNHEAKNVLFTAVTYQLSICWHGQWPSSAIHRECSDFDNVGVIVTGKTDIEAYSFGKDKWGTLKSCSNVDTIFRLENFNNELYAFGTTSHNNLKIVRLEGNEWNMVITIPGQDTSAVLIAHGDFMYILCHEAKKLYRFNPTADRTNLHRNSKGTILHRTSNSTNLHDVISLPLDITFECAFSFERNIMAFCDITVSDKHETRVYILNTAESQWTQCVGFEGPAKHMISFRDDSDSYILQNDGSLRVVTVGINGVVGFKFIAKLWDFNKVLHGAVMYKDCLNIFGNYPGSDPEDKDVASFLPGRFKQITHWGDDDATSNFVPATLIKSQTFYQKVTK